MAWPHIFGGLSGNVPASYLDDNFNAATLQTDFDVLEAAVVALPSVTLPLAPVAGGVIGVSATLARADHQHPPQSPTPNLQTGTSYTILASDNGGTVEFTNAAAVTVTIPSISAGASGLLVQTGAGQVTFVAGGGMTLRQASGFTKTRAQWSVVTFYIRGNGTDIVLSGDMS